MTLEKEGRRGRRSGERRPGDEMRREIEKRKGRTEEGNEGNLQREEGGMKRKRK